MKLEGITAIVTGAGGVVGHMIACTLAREGADIAVVTLQSVQGDLLKKIKELGCRTIALHCDITDKESVDRMVAQTVEAFGKVDLLVNNAGTSIRAPLEQVSVEDWDKVIAINLKGVFLCSVATAREMMKQKKGNIIEWARYNIRVNGVSPGPIMNPETAEAIKDEDMKQRIANIPLGRVATPEEIANAVLFLASQDCNYMTGNMLIVDGGGILTSYLYP